MFAQPRLKGHNPTKGTQQILDMRLYPFPTHFSHEPELIKPKTFSVMWPNLHPWRVKKIIIIIISSSSIRKRSERLQHSCLQLVQETKWEKRSPFVKWKQFNRGVQSLLWLLSFLCVEWGALCSLHNSSCRETETLCKAWESRLF